MRLLEILTSAWAISPDRLLTIHSLYGAHQRGEKVDIKAWEAVVGRPAGQEREPYQVRDGVAVLPIHGVMTKLDSAWNRLCGMTSTTMLRGDLQTAVEDPSVHSILLWIDSPGGMVDGTQELAQAVLAARGIKPVVTLADGNMCSAACWVGTAAEKVFITSDTTATGSIGVVTCHVDISRAEEAEGIKTTEITSGKYKRIASQYAPLSEEGKATIQAQLDHIYSVFVDAVAAHRGVDADSALRSMADGRVFLGRQAIEAGLVDGVSSMSALIAQLNQDRRDWKPGPGAAQSPAITQQEATMPITREQLQADAPDLLATLLAEGKTQGAAEERARIQGCLDAAQPGYDAIAREMAFDGKSTPGDTALAIGAAQKRDLAEARDAYTNPDRGPRVTHGGGDPAEEEARAKAQAAADAKAKATAPKARWESDAGLRAEFANDYAAFEAYLAADASGQAKTLGRK